MVGFGGLCSIETAKLGGVHLTQDNMQAPCSSLLLLLLAVAQDLHNLHSDRTAAVQEPTCNERECVQGPWRDLTPHSHMQKLHPLGDSPAAGEAALMCCSGSAG